jgi:hypothetical protein
MNTLFKNAAQLGAFGEFAYRQHAVTNGLTLEAARMLEYDFLVSDEEGRQYTVDVKTTLKNATRYSGARARQGIVYELISIQNNLVLLIPDPKSPLLKYGTSQNICQLDNLYTQWQDFRKSKNSMGPLYVKHLTKRAQAKKELIDFFNPLKVRVVIRGSVSETRWNSPPDNLPGSPNTIGKNDLTIFLQMSTEQDFEEVARVLIFKHEDIELYPKRPSNRRQRNKNIESVIDLEAFQKEFKDLVFQNLAEVINNLKLKQLLNAK